MKTMLLRVIAVVVVLAPAVVFSQGPKTKPTTATYITTPSPGILTAGWVHPVLRKQI